MTMDIRTSLNILESAQYDPELIKKVAELRAAQRTAIADNYRDFQTRARTIMQDYGERVAEAAAEAGINANDEAFKQAVRDYEDNTF